MSIFPLDPGYVSANSMSHTTCIQYGMVVTIAWTIITSSSKTYSQVCLCVTTYWVKFYVDPCTSMSTYPDHSSFCLCLGDFPDKGIPHRRRSTGAYSGNRRRWWGWPGRGSQLPGRRGPPSALESITNRVNQVNQSINKVQSIIPRASVSTVKYNL